MLTSQFSKFYKCFSVVNGQYDGDEEDDDEAGDHLPPRQSPGRVFI